MSSTVYEICKLVKKSPKWDTRLDQIPNSTKNESKDKHALCPNRWTVRGDALAAYIDSYTALMDLWDWSFQVTSDRDMKASLQNVKAVMSTLQLLFSCSLGKMILKRTDSLGKTLQNPSVSAAQGQEIAHLVIEIL